MSEADVKNASSKKTPNHDSHNMSEQHQRQKRRSPSGPQIPKMTAISKLLSPELCSRIRLQAVGFPRGHYEKRRAVRFCCGLTSFFLFCQEKAASLRPRVVARMAQLHPCFSDVTVCCGEEWIRMKWGQLGRRNMRVEAFATVKRILFVGTRVSYQFRRLNQCSTQSLILLLADMNKPADVDAS